MAKGRRIGDLPPGTRYDPPYDVSDDPEVSEVDGRFYYDDGPDDEHILDRLSRILRPGGRRPPAGK